MLFVQPFTQELVSVGFAHLCDVAFFIDLILCHTRHMPHVAVSLVPIYWTHMVPVPTLSHRELSLEHLL